MSDKYDYMKNEIRYEYVSLSRTQRWLRLRPRLRWARRARPPASRSALRASITLSNSHVHCLYSVADELDARACHCGRTDRSAETDQTGGREGLIDAFVSGECRGSVRQGGVGERIVEIWAGHSTTPHHSRKHRTSQAQISPPSAGESPTIAHVS
jgi:hypothetical protein